MAEEAECFLVLRNACKTLLDSSNDPFVLAPRTCAFTYCSTTTIAAVTSKNRESKADDNPGPKKRLRQPDGPKFDFLKNCLYCESKCKFEKDSKNPG